MKKRPIYLALLLVTLGLLGFQTGAYSEFRRLFLGNSSASKDSSTSNYVQVNAVFNYGNSTIVWYNDTRVPASWTFYNVTLELTNGRVQASFSQDFKEHQILSINGVDQTSNLYWSLWKFCPSYNAWDWSPVGVDQLQLSSNATFGWYFQDYSTHFPPIGGAQTIVALNVNSC